MSMHRRTFLGIGAAGVAGAGLALAGGSQALGALGLQAAAPTTPFAVGLRQYTWYRGSRRLNTYVYYPAKGTPGGNPIPNAPVADGIFPICEYSHGYGGNPPGALPLLRPMAAAGFIVPAPYFTNVSIGDTYNGNLSKDVSEVITRTLALNTANDPLRGHIQTSGGVGVSGHSMGAMTTHGLLTAWPDSRIAAAVLMSTVDMGNPSSTVRAKSLFIHGDRDSTTSYSSARQAYRELPAPKAFLTFVGGSHNSYSNDPRAKNTYVDWMRWSLYGDTAARDRLRSDATSSTTRWEFVPS